MSRDDIIQILEWHPSHVEHRKGGLLSRIERVVEVAVAAEREACVMVCEEFCSIEGIAQDCAAAIRARGQQ